MSPTAIVMDLDSLPAILTVPEVARVLRCSLPTVYAAIRQGDLASFRVGRSIRLSLISLRNFIDNQGPQGSEQE